MPRSANNAQRTARTESMQLRLLVGAALKRLWARQGRLWVRRRRSLGKLAGWLSGHARAWVGRHLTHRAYNSRLTVVVFVHVPKTGGTAAHHFFRARFERYGGINRNFSTAASELRGLDAPPWRAHFLRLMRALGRERAKGLFYIHCHHGAPGLLEVRDELTETRRRVLARGGEFVLCCVLREPYARMVSAINYNKVPPDQVVSFVASRRNFMLRYLLFNRPRFWPGREVSEQEAAWVSTFMDVVGFQADLDRFVHRVLETVDLPCEGARVPGMNVTPPKDPERTLRLDRAEFERHNGVDACLYGLALKKFDVAVSPHDSG